ncbi:YciI family protein [uncultured Aquimarina sp.]|uniref:YciI family protein n=1 Tax=uncultured Aquimarina sp. TaxID=575652 RepID=UPI002637D97B|nr:YciI family protein [uncultured Aquimarina sp.]
MKEFLMLIRGGQEGYQSASPNEMQKNMEHWQKWMAGLAREERLVGGQPLVSEGNTLTGSKKAFTDRPFAEGKELVGGYLLIKAESLAEATEIAKGCPSFEYDCSVEVREIAPVG